MAELLATIPPGHSGVTKLTDSCWCDEYIGTADDLAAAGIIKREHLPGLPGMRKHRVLIYADGTPATGPACNGSDRRRHEPGARTITRKGKVLFRVCVVVTPEERARRQRDDREYTQRSRVPDASGSASALGRSRGDGAFRAFLARAMGAWGGEVPSHG